MDLQVHAIIVPADIAMRNNCANVAIKYSPQIVHQRLSSRYSTPGSMQYKIKPLGLIQPMYGHHKGRFIFIVYVGAERTGI
jgi:hypothetical protein